MPRGFKKNHPNSRTNEREFFGGGDRRVSFKTGKQGHRNREYGNKDWAATIRNHLQDEDIDMGLSSGSGNYISKKKFGKKGGRRGSPPPNGKRRLLEGPTGWYRVQLIHGDKYEKAFLQKTLLDKLNPLPFWPMAWEITGPNVSFFVDDFKVAEKLYSLDRQLQMPNGFKLIIKVQTGSPNIDMTPANKEKIKVVMAKRYNAVTKALDLSKFHTDPDLQHITCALYKPIVFMTILDIIGENIPELEAINLHDNKISSISFIKKPIGKLQNLKVFHIGNNKIREIAQLDVLIGLPIVDLLLDGNPLCDKFKDQTAYISEVRKRLPKVMKLDGIDLPPPISFDIAEEVSLPAKCHTFLCNSEGEPIVRQFLEQYFLIYDSDNRQPLLQAYHEQSMFSLTCAYPYGYGKDRNVSWLTWYNTENRNLMQLQDSTRRNKLLKQGQLAVVSFLQEMPQTKHDIHSFTVDLTLFTPMMICLTVTGMFKELKSGHKVPPLRYFHRTLIIVPAGSGFCIANEIVHITNAIPDQAVHAFKVPVTVTPQPETPAINSPPVAVPPVPIPNIPDDVTKQQMVQQMCERSGMNLEWSMKCLEETQWDFMRAVAVFESVHQQGKIPPEAFVK